MFALSGIPGSVDLETDLKLCTLVNREPQRTLTDSISTGGLLNSPVHNLLNFPSLLV
jgi:hypothetical protein